MPLAVENASTGVREGLTKKLHDRGLVLWVDADP
jgi:hypothetical protein